MKITIISIGKISASFLKDGIDEYTKRIKPYGTLSFIELKEDKVGDKPSDAERQQAIEHEGEKILKYLKPNQYMYLLDLHGKMLSSETLAAQFADLALQGKSDIVFVIGGPFGVSQALREKAHRSLSLSPMTFTHQMVKLLLVEQIYRAFKINRNEPYHW